MRVSRTLREVLCDVVFTHYKREEDETMESGKLDEELARMSAIATSDRQLHAPVQRVVCVDQRA